MEQPDAPFAERAAPVLVLGAWVAAFAWLLVGGAMTTWLQPAMRPVVRVGAALTALFLLAVLARPAADRRGAAGLLGALVLLAPLPWAAVTAGHVLGSEDLALRAVDLPDFRAPPSPPPSRSAPPAVPTVIPPRDAVRHGTAPPAGPPPPPPFELFSAPPAPPAAPAHALDAPDEYTPLYLLRLHAARLAGGRFTTRGMVFRRGGPAPRGVFVLFKFHVTCCLADVTPVHAVVAWPEAETLAADQWVEVTGRLERWSTAGGHLVALRADRIKLLPTPARPYAD